MIPFTRRALKQIAALEDHYEARNRPDALRNLLLALREASAMIERDPAAGLPAPRPYPQVARSGLLWVKAGRYWASYRRRPSLVISAVYYESANIPKRL